MILPVYVPLMDIDVAPKSGIVGTTIENSELVKIYFEEGCSTSNLNTYLDRLTAAAGRLVQKAPTLAFKFVDRNSLRLVGYIDTEGYSLTLIGCQQSIVEEYTSDMMLS